MASRGKKKTTMAKLNRESKLQERRIDKQARKDARQQAALHAGVAAGTPRDENGEYETGYVDTGDKPARQPASVPPPA